MLLQEIGTDVHELVAIDTLDTTVDERIKKKVEKAYGKTDDDATRTAGLEKRLRLCVGCKMLKRSRNVDLGLVNGSVGMVVGFVLSTKGGKREVQAVKVKFDRTQETVNVEHESASFEVIKSIYYTRKQFPPTLAFAITIHKSQGVSLNTTIVDADSTNFGSGMVYVALSRVTSLTGLHLIGLDRTKIVCDKQHYKNTAG